MSKIIDLTTEKPLSKFDSQYVKERPWLIHEATRAGYDVTLADGTVYGATGEFVESEEEYEAEDYADTKVWTKATLQAEIDERNAEREDDDKIVVDGDTRPALVSALLADDEAALAEDDEEATE